LATAPKERLKLFPPNSWTRRTDLLVAQDDPGSASLPCRPRTSAVNTPAAANAAQTTSAVSNP